MENKIKVLVIDDERSFTEEMQELLQNTGYQAFIANTARQALNIQKCQEID